MRGVSRKQRNCMENKEIKPHFLTAIVTPALQLHKLRLPKEFGKDYGKQLPEFARLKVPNGKHWLVEIIKCNGGIWLHTGWSQFAEHYSIRHGHVLVFRYNKRRNFRVLILDSSNSSEINYSNNIQTAKHSGAFLIPKVEKTVDDTFTEISDETHQESEFSEELAAESDAKERVQQRAKAFHCQNPVFIVNMHKRNLSLNSGPFIPAQHCRAYFNMNDSHNKIALRANKSSWDVKIRFEKGRAFLVSLASGWKEFGLKNELKEGDVCVFELIHSAKKVYNVHIFRIFDPTPKNDNIPIENSRRTVKGERRDLEDVKKLLQVRANGFVGNAPGFVINVSRSYAEGRHSVHIPFGHSQMYLKDEGNDDNVLVVHGEGTQTWKLEYKIEESYPKISAKSWIEFRMETHLEIGDVCAFKMIGRTRKAYKVAIFRKNGMCRNGS